MSEDLVVRLEKLVDRLLDGRSELQSRCTCLESERDQLVAERQRFRDELDKVVAKVQQLEQEGS